MDNQEIAEAFRKYAVMGGDTYFYKARKIRQMDVDLAEMARQGRLLEVKGIGPKYASLIIRLVVGGKDITTIMQGTGHEYIGRPHRTPPLQGYTGKVDDDSPSWHDSVKRYEDG